MTRIKSGSIIDSHEGMKYLWRLWRFVGAHPFESYRSLYWIYSVIINFVLSVLGPIHVFIRLFSMNSSAEIMNNLYLLLSLFFALFKHIATFGYTQTNLQKVRKHLKHLDERASANADERDFIMNGVRECHRIHFIIISCFFCTLHSFVTLGLLRNSLMFDGYIPFDWESKTTKYFIAIGYQYLSAGFQILQNLANDVYPCLYLITIMSHFHCLRERIIRIGVDKNISTEENHKELKACIEDHKEIMLIFDYIQPIVSRTMALQFVVTGVILCISAVSFLKSDRSVAYLLNVIIYTVVIMMEVLPCCWYMSSFKEVTDSFTTALYSCNWMEQDLKFRKTLIIFMQRSQKSHVVMAANLTPITLQSYLAIIRFSFSLFTILANVG